MELMRGIALKLTDAGISNVAAYYASQPAMPAAVATASDSSRNAAAFTPPPNSAMPDNEFGKEIRLGQTIFNNTAANAPAFVGNTLGCASCNVDAGRLANSSPLWAAYVTYPAYRSKTGTSWRRWSRTGVQRCRGVSAAARTQSFNWGWAGMSSIKNAAGFIRGNIPLSQGNTLTDQDAWDVTRFMNSHERPQDLRFEGSIEATEKKYHGEGDLYGEVVHGIQLGKTPLKVR